MVRDADENDAEFDENWHVERVCQAIQKVRRLREELHRVEERKTASEAARKKVKNRVAEIKQEMIDALQRMRLKQQQIDHIVARLKGLVSRIEAAQREIADDLIERLGQFLAGERDFDDAVTVEDYILPVTVLPDGSILDENGNVFGKKN